MSHRKIFTMLLIGWFTIVLFVANADGVETKPSLVKKNIKFFEEMSKEVPKSTPTVLRQTKVQEQQPVTPSPTPSKQQPSKEQFVEENFQKAVEDVKNLRDKPNNADAMDLEAWYKQAMHGDNNTPEPSIFKYYEVTDWYAWRLLKGNTRMKAKEEYAKLVQKLVREIGLKRK